MLAEPLQCLDQTDNTGNTEILQHWCTASSASVVLLLPIGCLCSGKTLECFFPRDRGIGLGYGNLGGSALGISLKSQLVIV